MKTVILNGISSADRTDLEGQLGVVEDAFRRTCGPWGVRFAPEEGTNHWWTTLETRSSGRLN